MKHSTTEVYEVESKGNLNRHIRELEKYLNLFGLLDRYSELEPIPYEAKFPKQYKGQLSGRMIGYDMQITTAKGNAKIEVSYKPILEESNAHTFVRKIVKEDLGYIETAIKHAFESEK